MRALALRARHRQKLAQAPYNVTTLPAVGHAYPETVSKENPRHKAGEVVESGLEFIDNIPGLLWREPHVNAKENQTTPRRSKTAPGSRSAAFRNKRRRRLREAPDGGAILPTAHRRLADLSR